MKIIVHHIIKYTSLNMIFTYSIYRHHSHHINKKIRYKIRYNDIVV